MENFSAASAYIEKWSIAMRDRRWEFSQFSSRKTMKCATSFLELDDANEEQFIRDTSLEGHPPQLFQISF